MKGPRGLLAWLLVQLFALRSLFCSTSKRLPCKLLLPDFKLTLITAPAARPYSALKPLVWTLISLMASTDGPTAYEVWFRKSMVLTLLSTPFNRKLFWPLPRTPPAENP